MRLQDSQFLFLRLQFKYNIYLATFPNPHSKNGTSPASVALTHFICMFQMELASTFLAFWGVVYLVLLPLLRCLSLVDRDSILAFFVCPLTLLRVATQSMFLTEIMNKINTCLVARYIDSPCQAGHAAAGRWSAACLLCAPRAAEGPR